MATYIKTLKEDNGDITYPQTKAGAVLLNNGSDLETELSQFVTAEDIASTSALTPPVQTNMIADYAITDEKVDWTSFGIVNYSTSEVATGATWVNGSQIFKRSYYISAGPAADGTTAISFDSSVNLVIRTEGYLSNGVNEFPIPAARNTVETQIGMFISLQNHNVVLESNFDRTGYSGYITLWYTKS